MRLFNLTAILAAVVTCVALSDVSIAATVTGTVVSKSADTIVISTPSGQETYHVMGMGAYPAGAQIGSRVTVTYSPSTTTEPSHADAIVLAVAPASRSTSSASTYGDDVLPETAGTETLLLAVGFLSIGSGLALKIRSKR